VSDVGAGREPGGCQRATEARGGCDAMGILARRMLGWALELLAEVELPTRFEPVVIEGDVMWGIELNEFDVPQVVRYRVVK
jgi:hypothetical protein